MSDKKSIGGIWKKTTKNGKELLSISIRGERFVAWVNTYKKEDKHPDYQVFEDTYEPGKKPELPEQSNDLPF